jgi:hypothetical protein
LNLHHALRVDDSVPPELSCCSWRKLAIADYGSEVLDGIQSSPLLDQIARCHIWGSWIALLWTALEEHTLLF